MKAKPFSGMDHRSIHLNVIDHHFQFFSACKLTYSPIGWYDWRMDKSNGRILTVMSFDWSFITKCPHSHWFGYEWSKQFIICLHAFKWIDVAKLLHSVFTFFSTLIRLIPVRYINCSDRQTFHLISIGFTYSKSRMIHFSVHIFKSLPFK